MLTKAPSTDPNHLVPWLKTVVKREAWAIRRQRERHTPPASDAGELDSPGRVSAHDEAVRFEQLHLGAEALGRLKPHEVRAFVLKAEGLSYQEICDETGWTYTKVNRCLSEGRRRFHDRLAGIESGAECERLSPLLSALADGEARAEDMTLLRPHLRTCLMCRARLRDYRAAPAKVAAVAPPVVAGSLIAWLRDSLQAVPGWLSERSTTLAVRWQQAAELATAHKGAAVLASAALVGGGGATVAGIHAAPRAPVATVVRAVPAALNPPVPRPVAAPKPAPASPPILARRTPRRFRHPSPPPHRRVLANPPSAIVERSTPSAPGQPPEFSPAPPDPGTTAPAAEPDSGSGGEFSP
jgi:hypothetical protein